MSDKWHIIEDEHTISVVAEDHEVCDMVIDQDDISRAREYADLIASAPRLKAEVEQEKARRVYYQNIVYAVCDIIDKIRKNKPGIGVVCGTIDSPSTQVQEQMKLVAAEVEQLQAELVDRTEGLFMSLAFKQEDGEQLQAEHLRYEYFLRE